LYTPSSLSVSLYLWGSLRSFESHLFCDIFWAFVTILLDLMSNVKTSMLGNMLLLKCVNKVSGRRGKTCEETVSHMDACLLACMLSVFCSNAWNHVPSCRV
jgi:hypothetical protein